MPSSSCYTESQAGSQSSRGPHITQWLPQLVLVALLSLAVASIIGISLSAVAFSNTEELAKPGHGIAQSFVMFASVLSLFYIPLHLLASRKGESLYLSPPLPSFRHVLQTSATLMVRLTVLLWISATTPVAVAIYRDGGGSNTVFLNVDLFACATGLLFSSLILMVIKFSRRPFALPWISPPSFEDDDMDTDLDGFDEFGEKTAASSAASSSGRSTDTTLRGTPSPTSKRSKASSPASSASFVALKVPRSGTTSRSTSTTRSRSRKSRARTRRYVVELPSTPVPLLSRKNSGGSTAGGSASSDTSPATPSSSGSGTVGKVKDNGSEKSYFAAASPSGSSSSTDGLRSVRGGAKGKGKDVPVTPERPSQRLAAGESPSVFRFGRKAAARLGLDEKGGGGAGAGAGQKNGGPGGGETPGQAPPPPPAAPPPPVPTYCVPGAWVTQGNSEETAGDV